MAASSVPRGLTQLHMAAMWGSANDVRSLLSGMTDAELTSLVNAKAERRDATPLHCACRRALPDTVQLLLDAGADPNITTDNNTTPLDFAISTAEHEIARMDDCKTCVDKLLASPKFDIDANDRCDEDIAGPVFCCVSTSTVGAEPDRLLPILEKLLQRGFDPNDNPRLPALHVALRIRHTRCAKALVRAGADLKTKGPKDLSTLEAGGTEETWTALEATRTLHGEHAAREFSELAVAASAVAKPRKRMDALRAAAEGNLNGVKKLAKKALTAAQSLLLQAERWPRAILVYKEALGYPNGALNEAGRFEALSNMSYCLKNLGEYEDAIENARTLCLEFPDSLLALVTLGEALSRAFTSPQPDAHLNEAIQIADTIKRLIREGSCGNEEVDSGLTPSDLWDRAKTIRREAMARKEPESGAAQFARQAEREFQRGNFVEVIWACDKALECNGNNTELRFSRALAYYDWGRALLQPCSDDINEDSSVEEPWEQAQSKFEFALNELESCVDLLGNYGSARVQALWFAGQVHIVFGHFGKAISYCLGSLRKRFEKQMRNFTDDTATKQSFEFLNAQLLMMSRDNFGRYKRFASIHAMNSLSADLATHEDSESDQDLDVASVRKVLKHAVSLGLLGQPSMDALIGQISNGELSISKVYSTWVLAAKKAEVADASFAKLRSELANVVMQFAVSVHRNENAEASTRVIATFIKEAREWDAEVDIPEELGKAKRRVEPKRCGFCRTENPPKNCPCGNAFYCRRECQVRAWPEHKKTCPCCKRSD